MSRVAKFALMFIVFVDMIGQGLVFPIINALIMEPSSSLLPNTASDATRHFNYGLVIGVFFLMWFLGAPYISKLSDVIGRKNAILICLAGALAGNHWFHRRKPADCAGGDDRRQYRSG